MTPTAEGGMRISSGAFQNSSGTKGMSVVLDDTLADEERSPVSLLADFPGFGLVSLTAGFCIDEEQTVERVAVTEELAHGEVIGEKPKSRRRRFAAVAEWVADPA
jgi:hypothetical protein